MYHHQFAVQQSVTVRYILNAVLTSTVKIEAMWNTQHSIFVLSCVALSFCLQGVGNLREREHLEDLCVDGG